MPPWRRTLWWQAWSWMENNGAGRGSPSLSNEAGHPRYIKLATVPTFSFAAIC